MRPDISEYYTLNPQYLAHISHRDC